MSNIGIKQSDEAHSPAVKTTAIPDEDNLLEVPPAKAVLSRFPPGCPVLFTNDDPLVIAKGKVDSVFVDLTPDSSRDFFFQVSLDHGGTVVAGETQLQWAPQCTVWLKPARGTDDGGTRLEWKRAVIRGSYQDDVNADPKYSVQEVEPIGGLFHGLPKDYIHYRSESDAQLSVRTEHLKKVETHTAEPTAGFTSDSKSPTGVVDSIRDSTATKIFAGRAPPDQMPSGPLVAATPTAGEDSTSSTNEATLSLKRSISSALLDGKAPTDFGESAEQQASPPKRAKATQSDSMELSKTGSNPLTSQMLLQNSVSTATDNHEPRRPSMTTSDVSKDSVPSICASSMLQSSPSLPEPAGENLDRHVADGRSDVRTLTINIPKFADRNAITDLVIGSRGINHKRHLRETRCHRIGLKNHNSNPTRGQPPEPLQIELKGTPSVLQSAQQRFEDLIVSTVPEDQRGRMLFYLAKDNDYGASDGVARFQRSPHDANEWLWMAVVGVPTDFFKFQSRFVSTGERALAAIKRETGVCKIEIVNSRPQYIFVVGPTMESVNHAAELLKARVHWAADEHRKKI